MLQAKLQEKSAFELCYRLADSQYVMFYFLSQTALQGCDYRSLPNPRAVVCECVRTYVTLYVCYGVSLYGP